MLRTEINDLFKIVQADNFVKFLISINIRPDSAFNKEKTLGQVQELIDKTDQYFSVQIPGTEEQLMAALLKAFALDLAGSFEEDAEKLLNYCLQARKVLEPFAEVHSKSPKFIYAYTMIIQKLSKAYSALDKSKESLTMFQLAESLYDNYTTTTKEPIWNLSSILNGIPPSDEDSVRSLRSLRLPILDRNLSFYKYRKTYSKNK